uniref:Uncharacterized protein n=1 Tax=Avena sativa TaxID=4498 RepID=A0ACD5VUE6_AVESA
MKNTPVIFAVALSLATAAIRFAGSSEACPGSPSMAVEDACQKATPGDRKTYWLCMKIMEAPPREADVTIYAARAGKRAFLSYAAFNTEAGEQLRNKSLSGEMKDAYNGCLSDYATAKAALGAVLQKVDACDLKASFGDFDAALAGLERCRVRLAGWQNDVSVDLEYEGVVDDKTETALAYSLTRLAVPTS